MIAPDDATPGFACQVFPAEAIYVDQGANLGDALGLAADLCEGDIYRLRRDARPGRLILCPPESGDVRGPQVVAEGSAVGAPGDGVELDSRLKLMAPDGERVEVLVLRVAGQVYALPLSPMAPRTDYTLILVEKDPADARLAEIVCVAFAQGTCVTLADGRQAPIERLQPGDRLLTRDHGPQPLRWIGQVTMRATGSFAPVVITAGTLGNEGDLIVGQHHRIFIYQRPDHRRGKAAELLVQAKHLVDGKNVYLREGGYVDYFSLVFDRHEIVYAEGIPSESLMVNDAVLSRLPEDLAEEVKRRFPGLSQNQHFGTEAGRQLLDEIGPGSLFRRT